MANKIAVLFIKIVLAILLLPLLVGLACEDKTVSPVGDINP